jgi:hypothetical protein
MSTLAGRSARAAIALAVVAGAAGYVMGARLSGVVVHTGVASPAEGAISAEADGWTYNIPLDIPWADAQGVWYDHGRPGCLTGVADVPIIFGSVEVAADGSTWRQVVWVDCRTS